MKRSATARIFTVLIVLALCSGSALAFTCHCFNQRDYDPANPASVDPYVLATAGNSLLAGSAGLEKGPVVKMRMGGVEESDLWIALHAGRATGKDGGLLLDEKNRAGSWAKALLSQGFDPNRFGATFWNALPTDEKHAAQVLADKVLMATFKATHESVSALRAAGASTAEATAVLYLKSVADRDTVATLKEVKEGRTTWGALFSAAGIAPKAISPRIMSMARPPD